MAESCQERTHAPQHAITHPHAGRLLDWECRWALATGDSLDRFVGAGEPRSGETDMTRAFIGFIVAIAIPWASNAIAQTALTEQQPAAKIVVDPPLAEPLS